MRWENEGNKEEPKDQIKLGERKEQKSQFNLFFCVL